MTRRGTLFDRTPGALEPIDFDLSVGGAEYQALWPWGEAWCQELRTELLCFQHLIAPLNQIPVVDRGPRPCCKLRSRPAARMVSFIPGVRTVANPGQIPVAGLHKGDRGLALDGFVATHAAIHDPVPYFRFAAGLKRLGYIDPVAATCTRN
jgi:hypothetical protein